MTIRTILDDSLGIMEEQQRLIRSDRFRRMIQRMRVDRVSKDHRLIDAKARDTCCYKVVVHDPKRVARDPVIVRSTRHIASRHVGVYECACVP